MSVMEPSVTVEALLEAGLVGPDDVARAAARVAGSSQGVVEALVAAGVVERSALLEVAARAAGLEFVELVDHPVDASATALLPPEFARRAHVLPLGWRDGGLLVAVPLSAINDLQLKDDVARLTGRRVHFVLAARRDIEARLTQAYRAEGELTDITTSLVDEPESADLDVLTEVTEEAPVVRFVNLLITQAISDRASDIHIEPTEHDLRVRYRVDGVLRDAHRAPRSIRNGVVSRLKIMADMDISERRVPQDGRLSVEHQGRRMDLRVASLPTVWGRRSSPGSWTTPTPA